jgi:hypothetical protein
MVGCFLDNVEERKKEENYVLESGICFFFFIISLTLHWAHNLRAYTGMTENCAMGYRPEIELMFRAWIVLGKKQTSTE